MCDSNACDDDMCDMFNAPNLALPCRSSLNESLEAAMEFLDAIDWDEGVAHLERQDAAAETAAEELRRMRGQGQGQEAGRSPVAPPEAHVLAPPADVDELDAYFEYVTSPQPKATAAPVMPVAPWQQEQVSKGSKLPDRASLASAGAGNGTSTTSATNTTTTVSSAFPPPPQATLLPPPRNSFEVCARLKVLL